MHDDTSHTWQVLCAYVLVEFIVNKEETQDLFTYIKSILYQCYQFCPYQLLPNYFVVGRVLEKKNQINKKEQKDNHSWSRSTLSFGQEDSISMSGDNFSLSAQNVLVEVQPSIDILLITICTFLCHLGVFYYFCKYTLKNYFIILFISLKLTFIFLLTFIDPQDQKDKNSK